MDYGKILKRAWHMVTRYRALWIFGIILALTTVSWGQAALYDHNDDNEHDYDERVAVKLDSDKVVFLGPPPDFQSEIDEFDRLLSEGIPSDILDTLITISIVAGIVIAILVVIGIVARYVSETALIHMVDDYEETGEQVSARRGLRLGFSRSAWRLFLIDLVVDVPAALIFILLLGLSTTPLLIVGIRGLDNGNFAIGIPSLVATSGLFLLFLFLVIVVSTALRLLKRFFRRACVLNDLKVGAAIREGYALARKHLKDTGLMWLITLGIQLVWPFLMAPVAFLGIALGVVVSGLLALLAGGLGGVVPAIVVGGTVFTLVLVAPLAFLGGLREVFLSSAWTLAYRDMRTLGSTEPVQLPELDPSGLEPATSA